MSGGKTKPFVALLLVSLAFTLAMYLLYTAYPAPVAAVSPKARETDDVPCRRVAPGEYDCTTEETYRAMKGHVAWNQAPKARKWTRDAIESLVRSEAEAQGYADVATALRIIGCESDFDPYVLNYRGNSPPSVDRGLVQFNSYWQKRVTDECAFTPECAVREFISMLKAGKSHLWVCSRK